MNCRHLIYILSSLLLNSTAVAGMQNDASTDSTSQVVVQISGLVVTGDSLSPLPYATVFRVRDQRGTMTDMNGFFSMPSLEGDTLQFSSTGYISRQVVIPQGGEKNRLSIVQAMSRDTVLVSEAFIYPWPSRENFRQEFIALGLNENDFLSSNQAIDPFDLYDRLIDVGLDGQASATESMRQMSIELHNGGYPTVNLLNPVAWAKFIQAVKNGDLKRQ
jgi:hypothetical protein